MEQKKQAEFAMARINQAWNTVESRHKAGTLGQQESEFHPTPSHERMPTNSECFLCGYSPAIYFKAPSIATLWIFYRIRTFQGVACKNCGLTMSRLAFRDTLRKGIWGLGLLGFPWAMYRWVKNERTFNKLSAPEFRDPSVLSVIPYPSPLARNPFKDPVAIIAIIGLISISVISGTHRNTFSSASDMSRTSFGLKGTCYTSNDAKNTVQLSSCSSDYAGLTSLGDVASTSGCPTGTILTVDFTATSGQSRVACLGPWLGLPISTICYIVDEWPKLTFPCSTYPNIDFSICYSYKFASFSALDSKGNVIKFINPPSGQVWKGVMNKSVCTNQLAFRFTGTENRRNGVYKYRINFSNTLNSGDSDPKAPGSTTWSISVI